MRSSGIELLPLVPIQLRSLAAACKLPDFTHLSILSAGAPLDRRTADLAIETLGCSLGQVYGSSETGIMTVAAPDRSWPPHVGRASHHCNLWLSQMPQGWGACAPDEGVITVSSAALFEGYVTLDGIDRSPIAAGHFWTADRARMSDGHIELLGRISSAVNVAGLKIAPEEIEAVLLEFPNVEVALVQGVDDPRTVQRLYAYVSPVDVDLEALRRFCMNRLSPAKQPSFFAAVADIKTTASGKVIRNQKMN